MEYLIEFNSFFKKIKDAINDQKSVVINPSDVVYDIDSTISYIKDSGDFDVKVSTNSGLTFVDFNGVETLPFEKDFFFLNVKDSSSIDGVGLIDEDNDDIGFNLELIKDDLLACIDYIRSKYPVYKISIRVSSPRKKVNSYNSWVSKVSKSEYINIDDLQNAKDFYIYSISIRFII